MKNSTRGKVNKVMLLVSAVAVVNNGDILNLGRQHNDYS